MDNEFSGPPQLNPSEDDIKKIVVTIPRPILAKVYKWKVSRATILKGENLGNSTSKIHTFKPSVEIPESIGWLLQYAATDGAIMFENNSSIVFTEGKFSQFIEN